MRVSRGDIIRRGVAHRCPNCGKRTLFGAFWNLLKVNRECGNCGLRLDGESAFLGALVINYGLTGLPLFIFLMLYVVGVLDVEVAVGLAVGWVVLFPILFFRTAKSLWFMLYYLFVPGDLPANGGRRENPDAPGFRRG
jgi:uncharacterized protein (DUF983 family)